MMTATTESPYKAPETMIARLSGEVYGHPNFEDGTRVTTSRIVNTSKRIVKTSSGSTYKLGFISQDYKSWLKDNGYTYNQYDPFMNKGEI